MIFTSTSIPGIVMIDPKILGNNRGYCVETFRLDKEKFQLSVKGTKYPMLNNTAYIENIYV